jgi:uncharacterized protein (TIGR00730 family)
MNPRYTSRTRRDRLPAEFPKSPAEEPAALERVAALRRSPSYRPADEDLDFLRRDELRPERLGLEYLKPEMALREQQVDSTIVLFGGTRVVEAAAAQRLVDELRAGGTGPEAARDLAIAERLLENSRYYEVARDFARLASSQCAIDAPCDYVIMTGGGPGIMEAGNRGAYDAGRRSVGLNVTLPMEQFPNPYVTPGLCFQFRYFGLRKLHFVRRAKALVAFPGGFGTLDEVYGALCLVQTRMIQPMPIVLVGEAFWRRALDVDFLIAEGLIAPEDGELFAYAETAEEIWRLVQDWNRGPSDAASISGTA